MPGDPRCVCCTVDLCGSWAGFEDLQKEAQGMRGNVEECQKYSILCYYIILYMLL